LVPPAGLDVYDLRVVVTDLVGELGVDVHHLVGELAAAVRRPGLQHAEMVQVTNFVGPMYGLSEVISWM
jgi:hypothetical protein